VRVREKLVTMTPPETPNPGTPSPDPWASPSPNGPDPVATVREPSAPPVRRRRRWIPFAIVGGILLFVAIVVGGIFAVRSIVVNGLNSSQFNQPLVTGAPQVATAKSAMECDGACFTTADIEATVLSESTLDDFGITKHDYPWGTYDPTTPDALYRNTMADWKANSGSPDSCIFALGNSPAVIDVESDKGVSDDIEFTGTHASDDVSTIVDQSVRLFPDTVSATAYLTKLASQIDSCSVISIGEGKNFSSAEITPAPQLDVWGDMAAVGWVRTGDFGPRWRAYVFDIQRGNLVVRTRMITDGSYYESEFRDFVFLYTFQLEKVTPTGAN
jgi:hypothetical protein